MSAKRGIVAAAVVGLPAAMAPLEPHFPSGGTFVDEDGSYSEPDIPG